jgi:hypothetical protein
VALGFQQGGQLQTRLMLEMPVNRYVVDVGFGCNIGNGSLKAVTGKLMDGRA